MAEMPFSAIQSWALKLLRGKSTPGHICYGGAARGGKSWLGCYWVIDNCVKYPGVRYLIGRKELKTLKESTLVTFFKVAKRMGLVQGVHYTVNWTDSYILFANDSRVILKDLEYRPSDEDAHRFGSIEVTGAFIDEAAEVVEKYINILSVRVGQHMNNEYGIPGKLLLTCNPHKGHLYRNFYKPWCAGLLEEHRAFIPALAVDNPFLNEEQLKNLRLLTGVERERLWLGNWDYEDDTFVLCNYSKVMDLFTNSFVGDEGEKYLICDIAMEGSDECVLTYWKGWVLKKVRMFKKTTGEENETHVKEMAYEYNIPRSNIVFDSDGLGAYLGSYVKNSVPFHNGGSPVEIPAGPDDIKEAYANLRTQCAYRIALMINAGQIYVEDTEFIEIICEEFSWLRRDKVDDDSKKWLLPKKKIKEGLGHSPDILDCFIMRYYPHLLGLRDREPTGAASGDKLDRVVNRYGSKRDTEHYDPANGY